jgi:hypothetical protein
MPSMMRAPGISEKQGGSIALALFIFHHPNFERQGAKPPRVASMNFHFIGDDSWLSEFILKEIDRRKR